MLEKDIVGTWKMESWTYEDESGQESDYLGKGSSGILHYTSIGLMSVQIMKGGRKKFVSGELLNGTVEEIQSAFSSFFAYYGKYQVSDENVLTHQIEGSNFPNWVGEKEIRYADLKEDNLVLSAPSTLPDGTSVTFRVRWRRAT